ncbi:MAG: hypothetical protein ABSF80_02330 [Chitinispirillaceae bacterium]
MDTSFADHLFSTGEYYRATTEYLRCLHALSDSAAIPSIVKKISLCYFKGEDYSGCIHFLDSYFIITQKDPVISSELAFMRAMSRYKLGEYSKAIAELNVSATPLAGTVCADSRLLLGISYARLFDWNTAIQKLGSGKDCPLIHSALDSMRIAIQKISLMRKKSPLLSGVLSSIVPGAGYCYCRRESTGIVSLMINGILGWALYDAFSKKQYGIGTACFFFGSGWYLGNIKGSYDAAKRYNSYQYTTAINGSLARFGFQEYIVTP